MSRAIAAVALMAALVWGVYAYWNVFTSAPVRPMPVPLRSASARPAQTPVQAVPKPVPPPSARRSELKPAPQAPEMKNESKPVSTVLSVRGTSKRVPAAPLNAGRNPVPSGPPPMVLPRPVAPLATDQGEPKPIPPALQAERRSQPVPRMPSPTLRTAPERQTVPPPDMRSGVLPSAGGLTAGVRQVLLKDPLPHVDSILIDQERRLAIIDGVVVGLGDAVGLRNVIQIEGDAVFLREPSGLVIRVHLRRKLPG
jgi:hypothetical protein